MNSSPYNQLENLPQGSCSWTAGFWKERFLLCQEKILPRIYELFDADDISHNLANFRIAVGQQEGKFQGPDFGDGDFYKWLEGASYIYGQSKDEGIKAMIDRSIDIIEKIQRDDGYIYTEYSIECRCGHNFEEGVNGLSFQAYNLGHLITAGCVHHLATGETRLLHIAEKAAGFLEKTFKQVQRENSAKTSICPSHYMGLISLYRLTGKKQYLHTAKLAIDLRDTVTDGTDDNQDRLKLREATEIVGHAVRATYLYAGVTDLYAETGDQSLLELVQRVWENQEHQKMYINSGCGAMYDGVSPTGYAGEHPNLNRTHQSYGRPYELPNLTAYNETCASIGNILWSWRMFLSTKRAQYVDRIEQSFYNLVFAAVNLQGDRYFYSNMLERDAKPLPFHLKWERQRSEYLSSFCCPPNMLRISAESSEYAYAVQDSHVYTGLYGSCGFSHDIGGKTISLRQETGYPYDGAIRFLYEGLEDVDFSLHLRIPSWVKSGTVEFDGSKRTLTSADANSYVEVQRHWKNGDAVLIEFDMPVRMLGAHHLVEGSAFKAAVMRGPLLYCSEGCDNGNDSHLLDQNAQFRFSEEIISGHKLLTLTTDDAYGLDRSEERLYSEITALRAKKTSLKLIPYYAWDNRDYGVMQIWFPVQWNG